MKLLSHRAMNIRHSNKLMLIILTSLHLAVTSFAFADTQYFEKISSEVTKLVLTDNQNIYFDATMRLNGAKFQNGDCQVQYGDHQILIFVNLQISQDTIFDRQFEFAQIPRDFEAREGWMSAVTVNPNEPTATQQWFYSKGLLQRVTFFKGPFPTWSGTVLQLAVDADLKSVSYIQAKYSSDLQSKEELSTSKPFRSFTCSMLIN